MYLPLFDSMYCIMWNEMQTPLHVEKKLCENISIAQIKAKYARL